MEPRARFRQIVRPQDIVWLVLFAGLAIYGPDLAPEPTTVLVGLGLMQIIEPKIPFFGSRAGSIIAFLIKLVLWYILMGWTDGISSPYYWLMLLPVMSAATSLGLIGLIVAVVLACGGYFSLLLFLPPGSYVQPTGRCSSCVKPRSPSRASSPSSCSKLTAQPPAKLSSRPNN